jgi:hypothetical protein
LVYRTVIPSITSTAPWRSAGSSSIVDHCGNAEAQIHGPINSSYYIEIDSIDRTWDTYYNAHGSGAYTISVHPGSDPVFAWGYIADFVTQNILGEGGTGSVNAAR